MKTMGIGCLDSPFLGFPLKGSVKGKKYGSSTFAVRGNSGSRTSQRPGCSYQNHEKSPVVSFSQFGRRKVDFLFKISRSRSRLKTNCIEERFSRSKALVVRSIVPLWKEGLLLLRCSIFVAVISAIGLLVWYGKMKAKCYVEAKLLPSVCSVLTEYLQRKIDLGMVRSVSPLSITLESCSIGPHNEEFSCGEVPRMKIRVRPFASLKRGKIVIDAVLSQPTVLISQKNDFTWLGIPASDATFERHSSTEEGIDYRTKTSRVSREAMAATWAIERDKAAREAAENGYIVPQQGSSSLADEVCKEVPNRYGDLASSPTYFHFEEQMHLGDHHCVDLGVEHKLKHADLDKSFVRKYPSSGSSLWSRMIPGSVRRGFKGKSNGKETSVADCSAKRRILENSAAAALAHFQGLFSGKFSDPSEWGQPSSGGSHVATQLESLVVKSDGPSNDAVGNDLHITSDNQYVPTDMIGQKNYEQGTYDSAVGYLRNKAEVNLPNNLENDLGCGDSEQSQDLIVDKGNDSFRCEGEPSLLNTDKQSAVRIFDGQLPSSVSLADSTETDGYSTKDGDMDGVRVHNTNFESRDNFNSLQNKESLDEKSEGCNDSSSQDVALVKQRPWLVMHHSLRMWPLGLKAGLSGFHRNAREVLSEYLASQIQKVKSCMNLRLDDLVAELAEGVDLVQPEGIEKMLPVTLDSVYFTEGTLMLLGYGDLEPREMNNVNGQVKFQNHYSRVHVLLSGNCKGWRSDMTGKDGGWLSTDVVVDCVEQQWRANLKISNLFVPLFEKILDIPITWSNGRASGEIHICMSRGETFPNLHGQLDVKGLNFQIFGAPSCFSEMEASLCFRGQRIFLHNASGWFGDIPLEASGDFGINLEDGEFHLMCQVPCVEVNALMKTFKMKPSLFPLAGSITAVFNCQGPLDAPIFVGSGVVSRKTVHSFSNIPASSASEAMMKSKEAGAVAAFDRIPFSYVSANFTFNTDNNVADLYGIRATLLDGGEIRGAGNAWICPEGEVDETAMDVNFSGNLGFDKVMYRYLPSEIQVMPFKLGELNGETKLSGSLLRPRFDIKWAAPKAEGSFSDARGDMIISHDSITVNSSSVAFDLYTKVQTSYPDEYWSKGEDSDVMAAVPLVVDGVELDLRMRGFEFFSLASSYSLDSPRPMHLKATGRVKFHGTVVKSSGNIDAGVLDPEKDLLRTQKTDYNQKSSLVGDVAISGIKLNQLMLAPQLVGSLSISHESIKLDAMGRPDESLALEVVGPLRPTKDQNLQNKTMLSFSLQKGQLKANICYQPQCSANIEVRHLPLDELELASLRGTIQRAELQLNLQKRRGHGLLSVLRPKFSGLLGEALDVSARWSGDVITVEKTVLEQTNSRYELQGEYVLPGTRDRHSADKQRCGLLERAMAGQLGSVISSMGRWRMRLEVPRAEVSEMLPLARLLSRSTDPDVRSRSKLADFLGDLLDCADGGGCQLDLEEPNSEFGGEGARGYVGEVLEGHAYIDSGTGTMQTVTTRGIVFIPWHEVVLQQLRCADNQDLFIRSLQSVGICAESLTGLLEVIRRHVTPLDEVILEDISLPGLAELKGHWHGSLDASGGGNGDTMADFDFQGEDWEWGAYKTQRVLAVGAYSNNDGLRLEKIFIQKDNATVHADGTLLGPKSNLHFAVLNFPIGLVPTLVQVIESSATDALHSLRQALTPIKGILHMEGDLRGTIAKPECDVQVRLLDGAIGGVDLGRAEIVASLTSTSRFLFKANFEPVIQSGHVHIQGSVPVSNIQNGILEEEDREVDKGKALWIPGWAKGRVSVDESNEKKVSRERSEEGWDVHLAESLKGLNWNILDAGEVRVDADVKDGGMMLLTALCPYGDWLHGNADIMLQVRGTVEQPMLDGSASFHRASISTDVLRKPLTNFGGTVHVRSNKLCISSLEGRVSRRGKLHVKGNLPFKTSEATSADKIDLKCEVLEVRAKNILSGQVDSQVQITGSILQPNISGMIKLSRGEAYLPHDKGNGAAMINRLASNRPNLSAAGYGRMTGPGYVSRFFSSEPATSHAKFPQPSGERAVVEEKVEQVNGKPKIDVRLTDLKLLLGPELRIVYPLILNFAVSGELELNGVAHPKWIKPKGVLAFDNGDVNLVATQVRLKREHLNIAKFEPDLGLDPSLDLALVGSEWQLRIQGRASNWQDNLVVTSTRSVEQDVLSPTELAFKKLATATLETLMPRIEGKGEFGHARWRLVYAPQIPSLLSLDPTVDPLKSLANNISSGTEVEVQLGKRLQASMVRQMKDSEMATQWTLIYQLTSRLRVLLQSAPSKRLLFEYSATSQD
ncbi:hypothetical protein IFM89_005714 [Coptis chinensis]|uniref:Translocation and assembly module TamB C-terminal domain-containing protein n=1 Tax=Coptis chinensis TaxID=261450 RepID=A0A835IAU0_9MAGN|nr:hypothetical protein IFM89_005714 [Coptis chinensis]